MPVEIPKESLFFELLNMTMGGKGVKIKLIKIREKAINFIRL